MIRAALLSFVLAVPALAEPARANAQQPDITVFGPSDGITQAQRRVPAQLNAAERAVWRQIFLDIERGRFAAAEQALAAQPAWSILNGTARAQLWLARGSGRATLPDLTGWLALYADTPQAPRIAVLAQQAGATETALLPVARTMRTVSYTPRLGPRSNRGESAGDAALAEAVRPLLAAERDDDAGAEAAWRRLGPDASEPVRTEWAQRIAWSWYTSNDDTNALRMARLAAGGTGEWAALGGWVMGLAATRQGDCETAAAGFDLIGQRFADEDLQAAAAFWASRAHLACGRPEAVNTRLQKAAQRGESFYGLLARRTLGLAPVENAVWDEPDFITADWNTLSKAGGAKRAAALVEIGQLGLADRELRHLAATGDATTYAPLLRLAARLNLPATQYWLAQHPPLGQAAPLSARFPAPDWRPFRGWRVDKSLVFAHALQESKFITNAASGPGAKGVMQLMPGTAREVRAAMTNPDGTPVPAPDLADPAFNIELGQTYLEELRDMSYTAGLLPKVVAAYNAGPGSVQKWNTTLLDRGDPLLFIESIPFRETRHYVEVVLRNLWMYQLRDEAPVPSIDALAAGLWPKFPGMPGAAGVKVAPYVPPPPAPVPVIVASPVAG